MNAKGEVKMLGKIVLVLVITFALIYMFTTQLNRSIRETDLTQCKSIFDIDEDGFYGDDSCLCDKGKQSDQNLFHLKGSRECLMTQVAETGLFNLSTRGLNQDQVKKCIARYNELVSAPVCAEYKGDLAYQKGFSDVCAIVALEHDLNNNFQRVCATSRAECDKKFRENPACNTVE